MSWKTQPLRPTPFFRASSPRRWNVQDAPRVEKPLALICGACGASGRYDVGTVTLDPVVAKSSDPDATRKAIGFTGYFRCRACEAGGPWELPIETIAYLTALAAVAKLRSKDAPLVVGCIGTFDQQTFRYATDCEVHLKELIDQEPERAFLWVRLGNLYLHTGQLDRAETAYIRAIELDPKDIEAHSMFGNLLVKTGRRMEAVPHWHAVLTHVREARQVNGELRRNIVREAIESLLEAHAESKGQIDLLPKVNPEELKKPPRGEPLVLELREFDLSSEEGINDLCDVYLEQPRRSGRGLFPRQEESAPVASSDWRTAPIHRQTPIAGRNDRCPCGSGRKYKKCCGR